jgi:Na+/melibiose symporter-like transporter
MSSRPHAGSSATSDQQSALELASTRAGLTRPMLFAYAALAFPLAMAALPMYVHVQKFYADTLGVDLALLGAILLGVRTLDAVTDPLLGYLSDRAGQTAHGRRALIVLAVPLLAVGFVAMFHPPQAAAAGLAMWLAASLIVVSLGFSTASISYLALGAELSPDYHERTRVTASRGALGVAGVLSAAALPQLLSDRLGAQAGLAWFSLAFVPILALGAVVTLRFGPPPTPSSGSGLRVGMLRAMLLPLANRPYRWLIVVSLLSGTAAAIPGTLILFYVQDVVQRPDLSAAFLGLYFLTGAAGMPLWVAAARRVGKRNAWLIGMVLSVAGFVWAFALGSGAVAEFALVCALSGLAYGAELALPPSILADIVDGDERGRQSRPDGAYFGLWQMLDKLNLALAAGIALPALAWLGYQPGVPQAPQGTLSVLYALVPCIVKLLAAGCLWLAPLEPQARLPGHAGSHGERFS